MLLIQKEMGESGLPANETDNFTEIECPFSDYNVTDGLFCPPTFDGWNCINATPVGMQAKLPCPGHVQGFDPSRFGFRTCLEDATWYKHPASNKSWTNYTTCVDYDDLKLRTQINVIYKIGYSISLAALLISLIIFFYFKALSCTRIQIHKHLFVSLAINSILWLIWYDYVVYDPNVISENGVGCRALLVLVKYFMTATYFWMFCEGLYLHTLLVVTFLTEAKVMPFLYLIGWGVPAVLIIIYASLKAAVPAEEKDLCWVVESYHSLVLSLPVTISILANLVFLVNIVRLLLTKLQPVKTTSPTSRVPAHRSDQPNPRLTRRSTVSVQGASSERILKAARATLILIPLLGLQFILVPFRPDFGTPWEAIHQVLLAVVASFQGLCVALFFCFFNGEVVGAMKKKWRQCRLNKRRPWSSCSGVTSVSAFKKDKKLCMEKRSLNV